MYGIRVYSDNSVLATRKHSTALHCINAAVSDVIPYDVMRLMCACGIHVDVDRLPLVSSCIIQVAQDVDEPWPIEVYDHNGKAWNVTMQPGDLTLYESHTVLHGRPFPMKGRFYVS